MFSAAGGVEALKILEKLKPALIITDIIMEGTDGFDIILHTKKQIPETKIIAISGGSSVGPERYMDTAKSLGVDYTMIKPFSIDELKEAVEKLLN